MKRRSCLASSLLGLALVPWLACPAWGQKLPATPEPEPFQPSARLGMAFQFYAIDYLGATPLASAYPIGWNRILFLPTARVNPALSFKSRFALDNFGVSAAGLGAGHIRSSSLDVGSPFYADWAYASFTPEGLGDFHFGLMNLDRELKYGSALPNPFDASAVYSITLTRYGGVGTPPLTGTGALDVAATRPGAWHMGTNVALETIDPNSTFANFPAPALSLIYARPVGSGKLSLATMDGTPGASPQRAHDPAQAKALYLPANFPATVPQRQGYSVAALEQEFGGVRVQGLFRTDNLTLLSPQGKYTALTVEAGDAALAGSLTLAGAGAPIDALGGWVFSADVAGTGWGLGLGAKAQGLLRASNPAFLSVGPALRSPSLFGAGAFTLAAQQTQGPAGALASGLTLETTLKLHEWLPGIGLEYSLGKFDPAGGNALLDPSRPFTHQVFSVFTTFAF